MKLKSVSIIASFALFSLIVGLNVAKAEERAGIRQVKENIEIKFEKNKDIRNTRIEERKELRASTTEKVKELRASTTEKMKELREERKDIREGVREERKDIREDMREERKDLRASTTAQFKALKNEKGEILKKMQSNAYEMRKKALLNELNATISNLVNVRGKIQERITQLESKGRDLAKAKADLVIADDKIAKAKTAIETFANLPAPTSVTVGATTTSEVNLEKPRKTGDDAIKAVKSARDALKVVLKSMSEVRPNTASSTQTITQ